MWVDRQNTARYSWMLAGLFLGLGLMPISAEARTIQVPEPHEPRLERQCAAGNMEACTNLGWLYQQGESFGIETNLDLAVQLFQRACTALQAAACIHLGDIYQESSQRKAAKFYRKACDLGGLAGCTWLGTLYVFGTGVIQNQSKASGLFRLACEGGSTHGCLWLGWMYELGWGRLPVNPAQAHTFFTRACARSIRHGCVNLSGVRPWDYHLSGRNALWRLYEEACYIGSRRACTGLGWSYSGIRRYRTPYWSDGRFRGVRYSDRNRDEKLISLHKSCSRGDTQACNYLGIGSSRHYGSNKARSSSQRVQRKIEYERQHNRGHDHDHGHKHKK